jgi:signal transduction histidine kinase/ActR/RegA family two-component response regulator
MDKIRASLQASFSTKVLVPLVVCMVVLMGITVWLVNELLTTQFQEAAARDLSSADGLVKNSQKNRARNFELRFRNLPREPRYKSTFQTADVPTVRALLDELRAEQENLDIILYTTDRSELKSLANSRRDPVVSIRELEKASAPAVTKALQDEERVDTIRAGARIFDIVSIPVKGAGDVLIGALTLGTEVDDKAAEELSSSTHCKVVLLAGGSVIASSALLTPERRMQFAILFRQGSSPASRRNGPADILLGGDHYFCQAGKFDTLGADEGLGYLLLSSYEEPLRALKSTQQMLVEASICAIILGTVVVWFLVRKATQPLRDLRDSAEAVGRGDFSRRVEVKTSDECGELAMVFNQMTLNLKNSREQLEKTVESLKTTQAQLVQSEKLSGIGEFVAGVAHELNNPLTTVMGFSELLSQGNADPKQQRFLEMIHKSAMRCQKIVQSLLSFSRRHAPERKLSNLNELVEAALDILRYQMRTSNIEVTTKLDPNLPPAMVDPHQLQQVFLNIINNARQAIEGFRPNGWVKISTETCGLIANITIQDNGPGIPEENLSRVFDPFFTTKPVGTGTGLGLSLCYGIIKEHGGSVSIQSKPGNGATFVIQLPLSTEAPLPEKCASLEKQPVKRTQPEGGGKKVLVIDDEEPILQMVSDVLSGSGYQVDVARDGETALNRISRTNYDLALCDWKMPGLNGQQVYERIRATNPKLSERMIFITGDVINERAQQFLSERKKACLSKPFTLTDFRAAINEVLATA